MRSIIRLGHDVAAVQGKSAALRAIMSRRAGFRPQWGNRQANQQHNGCQAEFRSSQNRPVTLYRAVFDSGVSLVEGI